MSAEFVGYSEINPDDEVVADWNCGHTDIEAREFRTATGAWADTLRTPDDIYLFCRHGVKVAEVKVFNKTAFESMLMPDAREK